MEWENKIAMVQLGNKRTISDNAKKEFHDFVLKHLDTFDGQAIDMFCNLVDIIPAEMKKDIDFWRVFYTKIKDVDCNDEKFGFRTGMRISLIQVICEEELKMNIKTPIEILSEAIMQSVSYTSSNRDTYIKIGKAIEAIESYHSQFEDKEKDILVKFINWYQNEPIETISNESVIDIYLQEKNKPTQCQTINKQPQ